VLARRFLYIIAGLIVIVLIAGIGWTLFQDKLFRLAFVSSEPFDARTAGPAPDYRQASAWLSRPNLSNDPSRWRPAGEAPPAAAPQVAVFYVPPTTYYAKTSWNAPISDPDSRKWAGVFAASEAIAFNRIGEIWAPRYRSAALGAFLSPGADATQALNLAYGDVLRAFDSFAEQIPSSKPIILAGHSQSSLHMMRLMRERVAGKSIAGRIVAAYLIGWPISVETDVPALGLPACIAAGQSGCMLSWQSFAEPADPKLITGIFEQSTGLTGKPRKGTAMLCVNPLTGAPGTAAPASANRGTLLPGDDPASMALKPGLIPGRCDASGILLIGAPPQGFDSYVMPGNNYHVFDYALFWGSIRADAEVRTKAFLTR
jgi:hypothetical protein